MLRRLIMACLCASPALGLAGSALGDQWPAPQEFTRDSPSGHYHVRVIPGNNRIADFTFSYPPEREYAQAVLTGPRPQDQLTFSLLNPVAPVDALLFDDGSLVTFDNWHMMGVGKVIAHYDHVGQVQWSHELGDLLPERWWKHVPRSVSSDWWRKTPLEWDLETVRREKWIVVTLWNEDHLKIRLSDGRIKYTTVQELGHDAARWLNRARALADRAAEEWRLAQAAVIAFQRAIALNPQLVEVYQELAEVYERQAEYPAAIATLEEAMRQNPVNERIASPTDPRMSLRLTLASLCEKAGQHQKAEALLQERLQLDPWSWGAAERLAKLWLRTGRKAEADALLAKFSEWRGSDIGRIYEELGDIQTAKAYYLKACKNGVGDVEPYWRLAGIHERFSEYEDAIRVLEDLQSYITRQMGEQEAQKRSPPSAAQPYYEEQLKRVEEAVARLNGLITAEPR